MTMLNITVSFHTKCGKESPPEALTLDVENSSPINVIAKEAAGKTQIPIEEIMLLFCGSILNSKNTVEEAGLTTGDIVQCIRTKVPKPIEVTPLTTLEAHELHLEFARIVRSKKKHAFFSHMQKPEFSRKMFQMMPGTGLDPNALALLQDPAIFTSYAKDSPDLFTKFVQERPVVGRLAKLVIEMYNKDSAWKSANSSSVTSGHSYTLDSLNEVDEEDEMMMSRRAGPSTSSGNRGGSSSSLPIITPAQVAAALANVSGETPGIGPSHTPSITVPQNRGGGQLASIPATPSNTPASLTSNTPNTPSSHTSNTPSASHTPHTPQQQAGSASLPPITSEMLNSALQNVLGNAVSGSAPPTAPVPTPPSPPNMEEAVRLMAEMGIPDESLSRQALQMTNGDVQAAVELVFAQMNMFD